MEQQTWTAQQLQAFLRAATGHRLFPSLWLIANTGLRRNQLLGLRWDDIDLGRAMIVPAVHLDHRGIGHTWHLCRRREDV